VVKKIIKNYSDIFILRGEYKGIFFVRIFRYVLICLLSSGDFGISWRNLLAVNQQKISELILSTS
jgi:hypothetical protein